MKKLHSHESISCVSAFKSCDTWLTKLNMGVSSFPLSSNGSKTRLSHCRDDIADKLSWILGAEDLSEEKQNLYVHTYAFPEYAGYPMTLQTTPFEGKKHCQGEKEEEEMYKGTKVDGVW